MYVKKLSSLLGSSLSPPVFPDDEVKTRNARRVNLLALWGIALTILYALSWIIILPHLLQRQVLSLPLLGLLVAVIVLIRLRRVQLASHVLIAGVWVYVTLVVITAGGTQAPFFAFYTLVVITAMLLNGWWNALIFSLFSLLAGLLMVIMAGEGYIAPPFATPLSAWITQVAVMLFIVVNAYIVFSDNYQALQRAQQELHERKRIEAQLREEQHLLRILIDNIPDHIFVKDKEGRFILVNASLQASWNMGLIGKTDFDLLPEYRAQYHQQEEEQIITSGVPLVDRELAPLDDDPDADWQLSSKIPLKDADGKTLGIVGINRIITARKHIERDLRASEERYRIISELISDYAFAYDVQPDGSFVPNWITHASFTRLSGYQWDEIGPNFHLYYAEDRSIARQDVQRMIETGQSITGEYRIQTRKGELRWVSMARYPIWDAAQKRVVRFYGAATDITQRKRAEAALRESEARLSILNSIAHDISTLTDLNTTLRRVLEKLKAVLPLDVFFVALYVPNTEMITFPIMYDMDEFWDQVPLRLTRNSWIYNVIHNGQPFLLNRAKEEIEADKKPGTRVGDVGQVSASVLMAPLPLSDQTIGVISVQSYTMNSYDENHIDLLVGAGYQIAIAVDNARLYDSLRKELAVREQAEAEVRVLNAELEQRVDHRTRQLSMVNKELEAFAYSISHDLRAPLRSVDGFSRMVIETNAPHLDDAGLMYLERIRAASQRMGEMIDALLTLSRVTRYELSYQEVDLGELAQSIMDSLIEAEPGRDVKCRIDPQLQVYGDSRLLRMMLENLLSNAWKYSTKQPITEIHVGKMQREGQLVFFVRDNGSGFDPAYADKLFTVFQRLHSDQEFPGTGVGLATVQRIVRRHGGTIWAESSKGAGATFFFTLNLLANGLQTDRE